MCVSKARLSSYIATLSKKEMKRIDMELFAILDLIDYYKQFERQLKNKEIYILKLKKQLEELKQITNTDSFANLKKKFLIKARQIHKIHAIIKLQ